MIGAVKGKIIHKTDSKILIETASGICYDIFVSDRLLNSSIENDTFFIYTSLIVREQEMYLVGFDTWEERNLFDLLITAKGIGPKQGLKILNDLTGYELRTAIVTGDIASLSKIKGVSSKKAEQLILDLQEKMQKNISLAEMSSINTSLPKKKMEILLTMRTLGYSDTEIKKPLDEFCDSCDMEMSVEQLIVLFLSFLKNK